MARIKEVWPKDDVYIKKGSTGTPNALQCSGDAKMPHHPIVQRLLDFTLRMICPNPGGIQSKER